MFQKYQTHSNLCLDPIRFPLHSNRPFHGIQLIPGRARTCLKKQKEILVLLEINIRYQISPDSRSMFLWFQGGRDLHQRPPLISDSGQVSLVGGTQERWSTMGWHSWILFCDIFTVRLAVVCLFSASQLLFGVLPTTTHCESGSQPLPSGPSFPATPRGKNTLTSYRIICSYVLSIPRWQPREQFNSPGIILIRVCIYLLPGS